MRVMQRADIGYKGTFSSFDVDLLFLINQLRFIICKRFVTSVGNETNSELSVKDFGMTE